MGSVVRNPTTTEDPPIPPSPNISRTPSTATGCKPCRHIARPSGESPPSQTLREVTWRIHNEGCMVTYLPPLFFAHCGRSVSASRLRAKASMFSAQVFASPLGEVPDRCVVAGLKMRTRGSETRFALCATYPDFGFDGGDCGDRAHAFHAALWPGVSRSAVW